MPKLSNDWIRPAEKKEASRRSTSNLKSADVFYRIGSGESVRGRILGEYATFIVHWPRVDEGEKDAKNQIAWKNSVFPDAKERNYKPTRICTDDTPAKIRNADMESYLANTKCPWCKLKYQGYHGTLRHAFNLLIHPDNVCRIFEVPPSAMEELAKICQQYEKFMPEGPGDISRDVFEFVFSRVQDNKWSVRRYENLEVDAPSIATDLVGITDEDKAALKFINTKAETEEELLRGHDLNYWYAKDYMSGELQMKYFGEILELSDYEKSRGVGENLSSNVAEDFENEVDEDTHAGEEWGASPEDAEEDDATQVEEETVEQEGDEDDEDALW